MPFPYDRYPWLNFQELNLAYFIKHFREIFQQWDQLYHDLTEWKEATDQDLADWKTATEAGLESWKTGLTDSLETWKSQTASDISGWESATLAALDAWKTATTAVFEQIRTEAAGSASAAAASATASDTARAAAVSAQTAAEQAAADISAALTQIQTNSDDIADLKSAINNIEDAIGYTVIDTILNKSIKTNSSTPILPANIANESGWCCCCVPCQPGDIFGVTGKGGDGTRLWAFSKSDGTRIIQSGAALIGTDIILVAPTEAAYFAFNSNMSVPYNVYKGQKPSPVTDGLENEISDINQNLDDVRTVVIGKNLYNPAEQETGILNSSGGVSVNLDYVTSGFVPVDSGETYFWSARSSASQTVVSKTRYLSIVFDENGIVIPNSYQNVDATEGLLITVPSDGAYVRVSVHNFSGYVLQLEKGNAMSAYEAYSKTTLIKAELGEAPIEQVEEIAEIAIENSGIITTEIGKNILPPENWVNGVINANGSITEGGTYDNYETSDFVPVDVNTDYTFSTFNASTHVGSTTRKYINVFDETKTPITGLYYNIDGQGHITVNTGATGKYIRVSSWNSVLKQLEKGSESTPYRAYYKRNVMNYPLGQTPLAQTDALFGRKWAVCGDSFTNGVLATYLETGKYEGERIVYPYIIGNRTGINVLKFFENGQTLAMPAEPGEFTNSLTNPTGARYYQNIPADVDYITIYLGINDEHHAPSSSGGDGEDNTGEIPIGTIDDASTATYYGAWNVVLSWLIVNRPNAHIGIIVTNGIAGNDNYRQAQIEIAEKYGIPYIDLNGDSRTPAMLRTSNPNIPDVIKSALIVKWRVSSSNTHPNDAAHIFESTCIENFLRSL